MSRPALLYDWPRAAAFGRVVPKRRIYEHSGANTALKELFVRDVAQIVWSHKLAEETINLPATKQVSEIQVFRVITRTLAPDMRILRAMDRTIPYPLIFELENEGRIKTVAAYKRPAETGGMHWVVSDYFEGDWQPRDAPRMPLPVALNLEVLYERLLIPLLDAQVAQLAADVEVAVPGALSALQPRQTTPLNKRLQHVQAIRAQAREIARLKKQLARTKQFNRRVEVNARLRAAGQQLERMLARYAGNTGGEEQPT